MENFKAIQTATDHAHANCGKVWCNKRLSCQRRKTCNAAKSHYHSQECGTCDFNVDAKCISISSYSIW